MRAPLRRWLPLCAALAGGALLIAFACCGDKPQPPPKTGATGEAAIPKEWPRPTFETAPIRIGGREVRVELAETAVKRRYGYMFVPDPPADDRGMLFIYPALVPELSFWMRNTRIELDLVFVADDGRIINAHRRMVPGDETPGRYRAIEPCRFVIELRGGWLEDHGVWLQDRVELPPAVRDIKAEPNDPLLFDVPRLVGAPDRH